MIMNVELLRKVAGKLRRMRHKKHFDMSDWGSKNECGTTACIAGWALLESGYRVKTAKEENEYGERESVFYAPSGKPVDPFSAAQRLLGLKYNQASRLFHDDEWPFTDDDEPVFDAESPKAAAERIEHFIKTRGRE
jgi:hypothetical protein